MSVTNGERLVTKQDLADFYNDIRPYMGGIVLPKAGFTPIGTIISIMGTTAPTNYLACDGTVYNISEYTELANYFLEQFGSKNFFGGDGTTTFAVPDLRGEFLRGTGTNSHANQGSGDNVGVHQDGTIFSKVWSNNSITIAETFSGNGYGGINYDSLISRESHYKDIGNQGKRNSSFITSRPTNTSVLYCIATKNFYIDPTLDYSTDEKVVGTWIDGKPIYQKTVTGTVDAYNSIGFHDVGVTIDTVVHFDGIVNGNTKLVGATNEAGSSRIIVGVNPNSTTSNNNKWYVYNAPSGQTSYVGMSYHLTLQYTKTTD